MTTLAAPAALRKAAILISTLDDRTADALLDQMGPEQAARVRNAIMYLDEIPAAEQEQVINEFLRRGPQPSASVSAANDDVSLEFSTSVDEQLSSGGTNEKRAVAESFAPSLTANDDGLPKNYRPFQSLRYVEAATLARELAREQPQTVAAVLVHLEAEQVADLLAALPTELSIEALARMARIDNLSHEVLFDIERELQARLPRFATARLQPQGVANIQAALDALSEGAREELLARLGEKDARLLRRLGYVPPGEAPFVKSLAFESQSRHGAASSVAAAYEATRRDDFGVQNTRSAETRTAVPRLAATQPPRTTRIEALQHCSERSLNRLLHEAEIELLEVALIGVSPGLLRRVLSLLDNDEAAQLKLRVERPTQLRLRDIDAAQQTLMQLAESLAERGELVLPRGKGFVAAV